MKIVVQNILIGDVSNDVMKISPSNIFANMLLIEKFHQIVLAIVSISRLT